MEKKAQAELGILTLMVVIIGLIFLAPFILKIVNSVLTPFGSAMGNQTVEAGQAVSFIQGRFTSFWDWVIVIAVVINILMLLISSFLIDVHPVWIVLYIIFAMFAFIFIPSALDAADRIYGMSLFASEVNSLGFTDYIRQYFSIIMLGIYFITGVIIFAKPRIFGQKNTM